MNTPIVSSDKLEAAHDILHQTRRRPLDPVFSPQTIAVIGATETPNSVGRTILENLQKGGFAGTLYPVNPKRDTVLGIKAYPSIKAVPGKPDLAIVITPQAMTDPTATAECLKPFAHIDNKPILASWMGAGQVEKGEDILNAANIPTFKYPDRAAKAFYYMWSYSENLRSLYETPTAPAQNGHGYIDRDRAGKIISDVRKTGRTILTEFESKKLLEAYGIPITETIIALTEQDAVKAAAHFGFPVVIKLHSETITHKSDVGGVQLNLRTASSVRKAWQTIEACVTKKVGKEHFLGVTVQKMIKLEGYELIVGSSVDPQFGPVLLFGTGGQLVEVFKDRSRGA